MTPEIIAIVTVGVALPPVCSGTSYQSTHPRSLPPPASQSRR